MDTPLTGERLTEEKAFIKRYTEGLSSHKVEYNADYTSPLSERPRKVPTIQTPIAPPPDVMDVDAPAGSLADTPITLTVKSLKPSLSFTVSANLTDTVADLKLRVSQSSSTAPSVDTQRLLLKGKALSDTKLLKEYDLIDGATVHLVLKPGSTPASAPEITMSAPVPVPTPAASAGGSGHKSTPSTSSIAPPSLTISTHMDDEDGGKGAPPQPLPLSDMVNPPLGPQPQVSSAAFHNTISDPLFWQKIHALCISEFEFEGDADAAWEIFLRSMKQRLSAGEAAKIRDVVGVSSMGGGA